MATDSIAATSAATQAASQNSSLGTQSAASTEDRFLKMLVAQMRNQDPLNPLDNAQVTSQMAQLSTVSGLEKINTTLNSMISSLAAQQGIAAAQLVGNEVAVAGDSIAFDGKAASKGAYSLTDTASSVIATVKGPSGEVVRTIELGAQAPGMRNFTWDGKDGSGKAMPVGKYTFSVEATVNGKATAATTLAVSTVRGVIPAADGFAIDLGALGIVPFGSVAQILSKPSTGTNS